MDIVEKIKEVLSKRVDLTNTTLDTRLDTLNIDSLDLVEVMMDIEEAFNVEFTNDEIISLKTVNDVVELVKKKS